MSKERIVIILPRADDDQIANGLRYLTRTLQTNGLGDTDYRGGLLGGEDGYGVPFENDTFMMHPFCWCEETDCPWCVGCSCEVEEVLDATVGKRWWRTVAECSVCANNTQPAPNFLHKPSGSTIRWYKYIGRSMEIDLSETWVAIFNSCLDSLSIP